MNESQMDGTKKGNRKVGVGSEGRKSRGEVEEGKKERERETKEESLMPRGLSRATQRCVYQKGKIVLIQAATHPLLTQLLTSQRRFPWRYHRKYPFSHG